MGMSGDFPDAIAEGATIVRVGIRRVRCAPDALTARGHTHPGTDDRSPERGQSTKSGSAVPSGRRGR
jgi:hypothetical protein